RRSAAVAPGRARASPPREAPDRRRPPGLRPAAAADLDAAREREAHGGPVLPAGVRRTPYLRGRPRHPTAASQFLPEAGSMTRPVMTAVPASGHVTPGAPVVRELIGRGAHVTYYATEQFRPLIESLGAEFRAYPEGTLSAEVLSEATSRAGAIGAVQRLLESTP